MRLLKIYGDKQIGLEALTGSLSILILGFVTIPFAAAISGANISATQGIKMSFIFFVGRYILLYAIRYNFKKRNIL